MAERGKARYAFLSSGSNNVVLQRPGTLYGVHFGGTGVVRIDDSHSFPQGPLDVNASSSNTVGRFPSGTLGEGIGLNSGLVATYAVASNSGVTLVYE